MSDTGQGEGWWQASDGKWYPPEQHPGFQGGAPTEAVPSTPAPPGPPPTAAVPVAPPGPPPGAVPAGPPPAGPPPGSNARWIILGAVVVAIVAIAAFLLLRGDDNKKNVATTSGSSTSSSSSSSSSSSKSSSSSRSSSSTRSSSSSASSAGPSAAQVKAKLLKASDIGGGFQDDTFTVDNTTPTPCGGPNLNTQFPSVVDVGAQSTDSTVQATMLEEVTIYKDASTGNSAFQAGIQSLNCPEPTIASGQPVTFSAPKDVSSQFGIPEAVEIDFQASEAHGQLFAFHDGDTIITFQFAAATSTDTTQLPDPASIVQKGLQKFTS